MILPYQSPKVELEYYKRTFLGNCGISSLFLLFQYPLIFMFTCMTCSNCAYDDACYSEILLTSFWTIWKKARIR